MSAAAPPSVRRTGAIIASIVVGIALLAPLLFAMLPVGWLHGPAERALSAKLGRQVEIGSVARLDMISFTPRIALRDVRVAQPDWAGPGDMLRLRAATFRLPILPALIGRVRPRDIAIDGLRLVLIRDAAGRANWESSDAADARRAAPIRIAAVSDARVTLRDAPRRVVLAGIVTADAQGFRIDARGTHRTSPATLTLRGAPISGDGRWPLHARFASPLAILTLDGTADAPLDFQHFTARATAAADDIRPIGDLIGAGLPGTQAVRLAGNVRRDPQVWALTGIRGTIGRSDLAGALRVTNQGDRTRIAGKLVADRFDFDDLASDEVLTRSVAMRARLGPRVIPDTPVDLAKLDHLDGTLDLTARRIVSRHQSTVRAAAATVMLDHSLVTVSPLRMDLAHGRLSGRASVDQRGHGPLVALDLALRGARLDDFIDARRVIGPLRGRIMLVGRGRTLRAAMARADGKVVLAASGGSVERIVAEVLGRDAGAAVDALLGDNATRTPLNCIALRMTAAQGVLRPDLFTIDTAVMSATGRGAIMLDGERIALTLDGRARGPGLATLPASISISGTLSNPTIETADAGLGSKKTILKTIGSVFGRVIAGKRPPPAATANCPALLATLGV